MALVLISLAFCVLGGAALAGSMLPEWSLAADITPAGLIVSLSLFVMCVVSKAGVTPKFLSGLAALLFAIVAWPETAALVEQTSTRVNSTKSLKVLAANVWSHNGDHESFMQLVREERPDVIVVIEAYQYWMASFRSLEPQYRLAAGCALPHECDAIVLTRLARSFEPPSSFASRAVANLILPEELGAHPVRIMALHLNRSGPVTASRPDFDVAVSTAMKLGPYDFIAGDFNATPWAPTLRAFDAAVPLTRRTRWLPTWPALIPGGDTKAPFPVVPIDHIYAGASWRVVDVRLGPYIGSDHYPVIATFSLGQS